MRRFLIAFLAFAATTSLAFAEFASFDKAKFDTLVSSNAPVVVHTHQWWCSTCRAQAAVLDRLQKEPKYAKILMLRANPGDDSAALTPLKAASRSIILVFANGRQVGRLDWITDEAQIRALLDKAVEQAGG